MGKASSTGTCQFCQQVLSKGAMARHLESCAARTEVATIVQKKPTKKTKRLYLFVEACIFTFSLSIAMKVIITYRSVKAQHNILNVLIMLKTSIMTHIQKAMDETGSGASDPDVGKPGLFVKILRQRFIFLTE